MQKQWTDEHGVTHFRFSRPLPKIVWNVPDFEEHVERGHDCSAVEPRTNWRDRLILAAIGAGAVAIFAATGAIACGAWKLFGAVVQMYG